MRIFVLVDIKEIENFEQKYIEGETSQFLLKIGLCHGTICKLTG